MKETMYCSSISQTRKKTNNSVEFEAAEEVCGTRGLYRQVPPISRPVVPLATLSAVSFLPFVRQARCPSFRPLSLLLFLLPSDNVQHDLQHGSLITFPKKENLGNRREPMHQVYLPSVPTFGLSLLMLRPPIP